MLSETYRFCTNDYIEACKDFVLVFCNKVAGHIETISKCTYRNYDIIWSALKGQCHEIFWFWFFSWISFLPAPEYGTVFLRLFKFVWKFANIFTSQGAPPVSRTTVTNLPPVSTTLAENLPPVSTTRVANFSTSFASVVDTGSKRWEQLSNCWQLKMNLKKKLSIC